MKGGLILESYKFKDIQHELLFGAAPDSTVVEPIGRDISGVPIQYQGEVNSCVSCTVAWIRQYMEQSGIELSWPFLVKVSNTGEAGATPSQVLKPAQKQGISSASAFSDSFNAAVQDAVGHRIQAYSFLTDYSAKNIYKALRLSPLGIGVKNFKGIGPHFMAAYDVTDDGLALKCANWWKSDVQDIQEVPFADVEVAVSFAPTPVPLSEAKKFTVGVLRVLFDKIYSYISYRL